MRSRREGPDSSLAFPQVLIQVAISMIERTDATSEHPRHRMPRRVDWLGWHVKPRQGTTLGSFPDQRRDALHGSLQPPEQAALYTPNPGERLGRPVALFVAARAGADRGRRAHRPSR